MATLLTGSMYSCQAIFSLSLQIAPLSQHTWYALHACIFASFFFWKMPSITADIIPKCEIIFSFYSPQVAKQSLTSHACVCVTYACSNKSLMVMWKPRITVYSPPFIASSNCQSSCFMSRWPLLNCECAGESAIAGTSGSHFIQIHHFSRWQTLQEKILWLLQTHVVNVGEPVGCWEGRGKGERGEKKGM